MQGTTVFVLLAAAAWAWIIAAGLGRLADNRRRCRGCRPEKMFADACHVALDALLQHDQLVVRQSVPLRFCIVAEEQPYGCNPFTQLIHILVGQLTPQT